MSDPGAARPSNVPLTSGETPRYLMWVGLTHDLPSEAAGWVYLRERER
jgi:hypothetical protein